MMPILGIFNSIALTRKDIHSNHFTDILIFKKFQLADMLPSKTIPESTGKARAAGLS